MADGRILIVEDSGLQAGKIRRMLKDARYNVVGIASSASDAVHLARVHRPELVLMDVRIPPQPNAKEEQESGLQAARDIQHACNTSLVFMTAQEVSDDLLRKIHHIDPRAPFLTKPVNETQWLATIHLALLRRQGKKILFVCYAQKDRVYKNELLKVLKTVKDIGIDVWDDSRIVAGQRWQVEIDGAVQRADTAVLLVSVNFLNSRFIDEVELPALLAAQQQRDLKTIPVFVGKVPMITLKHKGLMLFQSLNPPDDPLNAWSARKREADAWVPLCELLAKDFEDV